MLLQLNIQKGIKQARLSFLAGHFERIIRLFEQGFILLIPIPGPG